MDSLVDAAKIVSKQQTSKNIVTQWGNTYGGNDGTLFICEGGRRTSRTSHDDHDTTNGGSLIEGIRIYSSDQTDGGVEGAINAIQIKMHDKWQQLHGKQNGQSKELILKQDEYITAVEISSNETKIQKLKFLTNFGNIVQGGTTTTTTNDKPRIRFEPRTTSTLLLNISGLVGDCINQLRFCWGAVSYV